MKYLPLTVAFIIGIGVGALITFVIFKNLQPVDTSAGEHFSVYTNKNFDFSLLYPETLTDIKVEGNQVSFGIKDSGSMDLFAVNVTPTNFSSTIEWLTSQPIGNETTAGVVTLAKVNELNGTYLIDNYIQVDSDNGKPIYGQMVSGVMVKNGKLYEVFYHNQFPASSIFTIDPIMTQVIASINSAE